MRLGPFGNRLISGETAINAATTHASNSLACVEYSDARAAGH